MEGEPSEPQMPIPSPKKSKKFIAIVIGMSAVVVVSLVLLSTILPTCPATDKIDVFVTAVDLTIVYNGTTGGYLGPINQSLPGFSALSGNIFLYTFTLNSSGSSSHTIYSITTSNSDFHIDSISPNLPYTFNPGSEIKITIKFLICLGYNGVLHLTLSTK